jgi:eukaryotic-like serine/threonine-protein kinase
LSTLLLVKDVIRSLQNGDTNKASVYLNLANQQLGKALLNILLPNATTNTTAAAHIPTGTFLTYTNSKYGIKIQYQYNWIVEGNDYPTGAGGIQIASFYLPDVNNGLPFFRIGVDNVTKEFPQLQAVSINDYLNRSLDHKNSTGFPGFKLIKYNTNNSLAGNRAYTVVWVYTHPTYGIRKSIEIATVIGSKGYFVDYTAAAEEFSTYLPIAQKMIESFGIIK